jgi:hypothetical protein
MRTIDIHAHLMPQCLWKTVDAGQSWYGIRYEPGAGLELLSVTANAVPAKHPNCASHRKSASRTWTRKASMCK